MTVDVFTSKTVDEKDIKWITSQFVHLEEIRPARGSLSYFIEIEGDDDRYHVAADWADCFDAESFQMMAASYPKVSIGIEKISGWIHFNNYEVVALKIGKSNYLDKDCINEKMQAPKYWVPILDVALAITGFFIWRKKPVN